MEAGLAAEREGLSPNLLTHAQNGQTFLGFISYRRGDGRWLAQWLRSRLTGFTPPPELKDRIATRDAEVGGPGNRVFLDLSYQRPNVDFWDEHIGASLLRSKTLLFVQTPSVFERLDGGQPNWCERELETFLAVGGDPSRLLVVMGPGAPIDRFPEPLRRISSRWDWIDLRFFSTSWLQRGRHAHEYDAQLAKILARLYDIPDGELPILNREFARARATARRWRATAAGVFIAGLSAVTVWALRERAEALRQRNTALMAQSRYLAYSAGGQMASGQLRQAAATLREALPGAQAGGDRPLVMEAVAHAYRVLFGDYEQGRLTAPADATALAASPTGERIVFLQGGALHERDGLAAADGRKLREDFPAVRLIFAPDGGTLAMVAADGEVALRALAAPAAAWRRPGLGAQTRAQFLAKGARLLLSAADGSALRLLDAATGDTLAEAKPAKPATLFVEGDDLFVFAAGEAQRLSSETLETTARAPVDATEQYAAALSPDRASLYVAAADRLAKGRLIEFDAKTLAQKRAFGSLAFGANSLAVDSVNRRLAVGDAIGVEIFDIEKGDLERRLKAKEPILGGAFVGGYYLGYAGNGVVRRWSAFVGDEAEAYTSAGPVEQLIGLTHDDAFVTVTDRAVTRWGLNRPTRVRRYLAPVEMNGVRYGIHWPILASQAEDGEATAAYVDGSVRRWRLMSGTVEMTRPPNRGADAIAQVVGLPGGAVLAATAAGRLEAYRREGPPATVEVGPLAYLGPLERDAAFAVTTAGAALRIETGADGAPRVATLTPPGGCPNGGSGAGFSLCVTPDSGFLLRRAHAEAVFPKCDSAWENAVATRDGAFFAVSEYSGRVTQWSGDGTRLHVFDLTTRLQGAVLQLAQKSFHLTPQPDDAKGRTVAVPAGTVAMSEDGRRLAVGLALGELKLIDAETGRIREARFSRDAADIEAVAFSANGLQVGVVVAVVTQGFVGRRLAVFDFESGFQILSVLLDGSKTRLYPLPDGRGFTTIDPNGEIETFPVFEDWKDSVADLVRLYPDRLTPDEKREYYLE